MATFNVKVVVEYEYEVECDTAEEAEKQGWNYEDYAHHASVDKIEVEEVEEVEDEPDDETDDAYALASAGFGTDEDYGGSNDYDY
jgi:hypothetical protein